MNQYGAQAQRHWRTHLPARYRALTDPEAFFGEMGEQIAEQVQQVAKDLAGPDPAGESYLDKVGRLNMARLTAEAQVLRETLPAPESDAQNTP